MSSEESIPKGFGNFSCWVSCVIGNRICEPFCAFVAVAGSYGKHIVNGNSNKPMKTIQTSQILHSKARGDIRINNPWQKVTFVSMTARDYEKHLLSLFANPKIGFCVRHCCDKAVHPRNWRPFLRSPFIDYLACWKQKNTRPKTTWKHSTTDNFMVLRIAAKTLAHAVAKLPKL